MRRFGLTDLAGRWRRAEAAPDAQPAPAPADPPPETLARFANLSAWREWSGAHPEIFDPDRIAAVARHGLAHGLQSVFFGRIGPEAVSSAGSDHRELLHALGLNSRMRAMLDLVAEHVRDRPFEPLGPRIYAHEALTPFALFLRGRYPRFIGSEYASTPDQARALFPIPVVDIARSPFPDASFDLVLSGEVLEHVPDLAATLADTARILRPRGRLLATFPFAENQDAPIVRAVLRDGVVYHLMEPERHGNPTDPEGGSLVFQIPGWSILDDLRAIGFSTAEMVYISSPIGGVAGAHMAGVLVLDAMRAG